MNKKMMFKKLGIFILVIFLIFAGILTAGAAGFASNEGETDEEIQSNVEKQNDTTPVESKKAEENGTTIQSEAKEEQPLLQSKIYNGFLYTEYADYISIDGYIDWNVKELVIPDKINGKEVQEISQGAFYYYFKDLNSVTIPDSVKYIYARAFAYSGLKTVKFGKNLISIGQDAFSNSQLTDITFPENLKKIGSSAFSTNNIKTVKFNNNLEEIGSYAFYNNQITDLVFPSNLKNIKNNAFSLNPLKTIKLNTNLESIGPSAFGDCTGVNNYKNLKRIIFPSDTKIQDIGEMCLSIHDDFAIYGPLNNDVINQIISKKRNYRLIDINDPFDFIMNPNGTPMGWTPYAYTTVTVNTKDNSKIREVKYKWSTSTKRPNDSEWTTMKNNDNTNSFTNKFIWDSNGLWYLHVLAVDEYGLEKYYVSDVFVVDRYKPKSLTLSPDGMKNQDKKELSIEIGKSAKQVFPGTLVKIKGTNTSILMPDDLPEGTTLKVEPVNMAVKGYKQVGEMFNFIFAFPSGKENYKGNFILTLGVHQDGGNSAIYYYNEQTKSLEKIGGKINGNAITAKVNHFSTYGVFTEANINNQLPETATNMYNWLLIGIGFVFCAIFMLSIKRKRNI